MTFDANILKDLDESYLSKVKIGNGEMLDVKGRGATVIDTPVGTKYIQDVLYVPKINHNLLSVGQMLEKGYSLHFQNKSCTIVDPCGSELMTVNMIAKNFAIDGNVASTKAYQHTEIDSNLWHRRLGHFNYVTLKICMIRS